MAEGVRRASNSHYAVATTGIAGPYGRNARISRRLGMDRRQHPATHHDPPDPCRRQPQRRHPKAGTAAIELLEEELRAANRLINLSID